MDWKQGKIEFQSALLTSGYSQDINSKTSVYELFSALCVVKLLVGGSGLPAARSMAEVTSTTRTGFEGSEPFSSRAGS